MRAIEKVYMILGENVFSEFEAEFHFNWDDVNIEYFINMLRFNSTGVAFLWFEARGGFEHWSKIDDKLIKKWSNYGI